jgi:hypothetical protein
MHALFQLLISAKYRPQSASSTVLKKMEVGGNCMGRTVHPIDGEPGKGLIYQGL